MREIKNTAQRLAVLGRPYTSKGGKLVADAEWAQKNLVAVALPSPLPPALGKPSSIREVRVHRLLAVQFQRTFAELDRLGLWPLIHTCAGTYVVRFVRDTPTSPSPHCFGCAIDFDAELKPLGKYNPWLGEFVAVWNRHGAINGGIWKRRDDMHFEFVKCYGV